MFNILIIIYAVYDSDCNTRPNDVLHNTHTTVISYTHRSEYVSSGMFHSFTGPEYPLCRIDPNTGSPHMPNSCAFPPFVG